MPKKKVTPKTIEDERADKAMDKLLASSNYAELAQIAGSMEIWRKDKKAALRLARDLEMPCFECVEILAPSGPIFGVLANQPVKWLRSASEETWYCVSDRPPKHPRWKIVREVVSC